MLELKLEVVVSKEKLGLVEELIFSKSDENKF